jgi:hypothetical protein
MRRYGNFTPGRAAALRKAQLASAARRRGSGRGQLVTRKRALGAVGVLAAAGAVGGAAYGVHRAQGNAIVSSVRTPTVRNPYSGKVVGAPRGLSRTPTGLAFTSRTAKGDKTVLYARGVKGKMHGSKIGGAPHTVKNFKPSNADFKNMRRYNKPVRGTEQYAREAMKYPHGPTAYLGRKVESGEAIRRTRSYVQGMEAKGKKVSVGHRMAASQFFSQQPRYTGGTVKPLKGMTRRRARRLYKTRNSIVDPRVLGSRKRNG